jgi:hypothetical protein
MAAIQNGRGDQCLAGLVCLEHDSESLGLAEFVDGGKIR